MTVRNMFGRHLDARHADELLAALAPLPPRVLAAMAIAAESGKLRRWSWYMCPLGRAGRILGHNVASVGDTARALEVTNGAVERFVAVWDHLPGTRRSRTLMLRAALDRLLPRPGGVATATLGMLGGRCRVHTGRHSSGGDAAASRRLVTVAAGAAVQPSASGRRRGLPWPLHVATAAVE